MQSTSSVDSTSSPAPRDPPRTLLGKLLSVLRGDKYMADAYPPRWQAAIPMSAEGVVAADQQTVAAVPARAPDDADRWADEGGSVAFETADLLRVAGTRR
jgi:hypothetical protein